VGSSPATPAKVMRMEIRWKSDKEKYEAYKRARQALVKLKKKTMPPERLTRRQIERMMIENQTIGCDTPWKR
jgi:hypothetical protein